MKFDILFVALCALAIIVGQAFGWSLATRIFAGIAAAILTVDVVFKAIRMIRRGRRA